VRRSRAQVPSGGDLEPAHRRHQPEASRRRPHQSQRRREVPPGDGRSTPPAHRAASGHCGRRTSLRSSRSLTTARRRACAIALCLVVGFTRSAWSSVAVASGKMRLTEAAPHTGSNAWR
jgi:hypothetical protein